MTPKCDYYWMPDESRPPLFVSWFWDVGEVPHRPESHGPFATKAEAKADRARFLAEQKSLGAGDTNG